MVSIWLNRGEKGGCVGMIIIVTVMVLITVMVAVKEKEETNLYME